MFYNFDIDVAKEYGVNEAIMIANFQFWITKNKANNKSYYDNHYWTYNSKNALQKLFPFWTERQIRYILDSLIDKGVLITANYNKNKYDKTLWYAFADEEKWIKISTEKDENPAPIDMTKVSNQTDSPVQPIPDNKTNNKQNSNSDSNTFAKSNVLNMNFTPPTIEELFTYAKTQNDFAGTTGFVCSKHTAELFWSHYQANGWVDGNKTPLWDWKAKLREWCIRNKIEEMKKGY